MAQPVTLAQWEEAKVAVGDVNAAIARLRRQSPLPPARAAVLTLVVVASTEERADWACRAVHELGGRHPARLLTLVLDPEGETSVDARVALLGGEASGQGLWFEEVTLHAHGQLVEHLDSLIEPFTLPDLPVAAWFVEGLPGASDPLLGAADVLIVDARAFGAVETFATLDTLLRRLPVVDLSWMRMQPWRELLAALFEGRHFRPFGRGVRAATVEGRTGPAHLLAGWLEERLALPASQLRLAEASHLALRLEAEAGGRAGTFEVFRPGDERSVVARARIEDGPSAERVVSLPDASPSWGLTAALSALERDRVFEHALRRAISLASR